MGDADSGNA